MKWVNIGYQLREALKKSLDVIKPFHFDHPFLISKDRKTFISNKTFFCIASGNLRNRRKSRKLKDPRNEKLRKQHRHRLSNEDLCETLTSPVTSKESLSGCAGTNSLVS